MTKKTFEEIADEAFQEAIQMPVFTPRIDPTVPADPALALSQGAFDAALAAIDDVEELETTMPAELIVAMVENPEVIEGSFRFMVRLAKQEARKNLIEKLQNHIV